MSRERDVKMLTHFTPLNSTLGLLQVRVNSKLRQRRYCIVTDGGERNRPAWVFNTKDDTQGIPRVLGPGLSTRIFVGDNVMLSVVRIEPHSEGTVHSHPEEQWGLLLEGECVRIQGEEDFHMKSGDFWQTPGGVRHGMRTGDVGATVLDIFSPPREEYRKSGTGFGQSD